jgi:hypothetical protein
MSTFEERERILAVWAQASKQPWPPHSYCLTVPDELQVERVLPPKPSGHSVKNNPILLRTFVSMRKIVPGEGGFHVVIMCEGVVCKDEFVPWRPALAPP